MENASKALIMAAGVLIGILIISLGVYLFMDFGHSAAEVHKKVEEEQLKQFNSQYTSYTGREDLTIHDVITVGNMATQNNIYYELEANDTNRRDDKSFYISVTLDDRTVIGGSARNDIERGYVRNSVNNNINELNDYNEELIKRHVDDMTINLATTMPRITCTAVEVSEVTRRVHKISFATN